MLDFDFLYSDVIRPAVQDEGLECRRLDEVVEAGGIWHKALLSTLISSDLMIVDVSTDNPNVMYELGVRHALSRGRTILISARGWLPRNSYLQALVYEATDTRLIGPPAERFREALKVAVRQALRSAVPDSPIYQVFPDLEVILPAEIETTPRARPRARTRDQRGFTQSVIESPERARGDLERSVAEIRGAPAVDPTEYLKVMRRYRDLSDWDHVIALGDDAPPEIANSPEARQLVALALNRRGGAGDSERAVAMMEQEVAETGGDSETFGILGRIYKDRYDHAKADGNEAEAAEHLDLALRHYRAGFEKNPGDYYPGINVVNLLARRGDADAQKELAEILPRVRDAVQSKLDPDRPDYWVLATDLELATLARDWSHLEQTARMAVAQAPARWMLETTARNLHGLGEALADGESRSHIDNALKLFESASDNLTSNR
jgi:tetratricopeptide (TPR) repeat protein